MTPGFKLCARWVAHAVGPAWRGGGHGEPRQLEGCYRRALELARECGARSIAFPAISTGIYGYPREAAARIAWRTMREYEPRFEEIIACCFSEDDAAVYRGIAGGRVRGATATAPPTRC